MKLLRALVPALVLCIAAQAAPAVFCTRITNSRKDHKLFVYGLEVKTGKTLWERRLPSCVNAIEQVADGALVLGDDGKVFLLDRDTGEIRWTCFTGKPGDCINRFQMETEEGYLVSDLDDGHWLISKDGKVVWSVR